MTGSRRQERQGEYGHAYPRQKEDAPACFDPRFGGGCWSGPRHGDRRVRGSIGATASTAGPTFALHGTAVGGIKVIQTGQTLTFLFKETNKGPGSAPEDLALKKVTNATVVALTCVLPNGFAINSDGSFCEPGILSPGQSASSVITTNVTGGSGSVVSARLCLDNENTGVVGPCKTVSVKIA